MLTKEVALNFLKNTLHIEEAEAKLKTNRLDFLNEIIVAQHQYVPYQTFTMMATATENRKGPTQDDCIAANLDQTGGVCVTQQGFFACLLQALDYDAYLVTGDVCISNMRDDHVIVIVRDLQQKDDKYYVDVGLSYPSLCAIPLHNMNDGDYKIYEFSFLSTRISKEGQYYVRSHKKKDINTKEASYWQKFVQFQPDIPQDFSSFDKIMHAVFTNESESRFLKNCFASRYMSEMAITVNNLTVKIWHKDTQSIKQMDFDSTEKVSEKIAELFPMIPAEVIRKGYQEWERLEQLNAGKPKLSGFSTL